MKRILHKLKNILRRMEFFERLSLGVLAAVVLATATLVIAKGDGANFIKESMFLLLVYGSLLIFANTRRSDFSAYWIKAFATVTALLSMYFVAGRTSVPCLTGGATNF